MSAVRTATGLGSTVAMGARDAASAAVVIASASIRTATGLKTFFGAMSAIAEPSGAGGLVNTQSPAPVTTGQVTATPAGGAPPYTYLWEVDGAGWTPTDSTLATTAFISPDIDPGLSEQSVARCTVEDSGGIQAITNDVSLSATNLGGNL